MKKKVVLIILILLTVLVFIELFIYKFINLPFNFQVHSQNRTDLLTFLGILVSSTISLSVYLLSKKIEEQNNLEKKKDRYKAICTIYDYLTDATTFIKKKLFDEREDYLELKYNKKFLKSVYTLNNDLFDEDDIEYLRSLDKTINNFLESKKDLAIKWVTKNMFDLNMPFSKLKEMNNMVSDNMLLNTRLVMIIAKLKKELNYKYEETIFFENIKLIIKTIKNKIIVEKRYGSIYSIINGKGYVEVHEPVFLNNPRLTINDNVIYEGHVKNYKFNGEGTYYYYIKDNDKYFIDSYALIEANAKKITKILEINNLNSKVCLKVEGVFDNGIIDYGKIKSEKEEYNDINV